jgi:hypothetical protein
MSPVIGGWPLAAGRWLKCLLLSQDGKSMQVVTNEMTWLMRNDTQEQTERQSLPLRRKERIQSGQIEHLRLTILD